MPNDEQTTEAWRTCRVGSCNRHQDCMYMPCRSTPQPFQQTTERAGNWYRVDAPDDGFTCGVRVSLGRISGAGPSLANIVGWEFGDAIELFRERGWKIEGPLAP